MNNLEHHKTCTKCGESKPVSGFYRERLGALGVSSRCKPCNIAKSVAYNSKNKEARRVKRIKYRDTDKATSAVWRENNREALREYAKRYAEENKSCRAASQASRRAAKRNATVLWDLDFTEFVSKEAADLAAMRGVSTGFKWHVDHMIPMRARKVCGLHVWNNLQVIPARMNQAKKNSLVLTEIGEWLTHG